MKRHRFAIGNVSFAMLVIAVLAYFGFEWDMFRVETTASLDTERRDLNRVLLASAILISALLAFGWLRLRNVDHERGRRVQAERRAHDAARHDVLTGLPNRRMFREQAGTALGTAWREGSRCAVFFIDLDGFKPVNDTHGHAAGDAVLIEVAGRLKGCVPDAGCVARLGGDEFAVLTTGHTGIDQPALTARRILRELEKPYLIDGGTVNLGATVGVAVGPDHGTRADDLITAADRAMYDGKRHGKRQVRLYQAA